MSGYFLPSDHHILIMALHKEVKNGNGLSPEPTHALCCIGKQFTLVSREGEEITIPVYYLLAWS